MNSYELSRQFFDWSFENPEKITPTHIAMYFFIIEHCNRLGWKEKFGLPTTMVKDAIGIKNFRTYTNALNDLVDWGFIKMVEKSKNQYSCNIIAIVNFTKAPTIALDKALQKHSTKQRKSIDSIDKQVTINNKPIKQYIDLTFLNLEMDNMNIFPDQYEKLTKDFGEAIANKAIKYLSDWKIEKGKESKSDYLTIRRWVIDAVKKKLDEQRTMPEPIRKQSTFEELKAKYS